MGEGMTHCEADAVNSNVGLGQDVFHPFGGNLQVSECTSCQI